MKKTLPLACLCLMLAACDKPIPAPTQAPHAEGETVIFPADSPQMKALSTIVAEVATEEGYRLSGRLGWDESRTVRVFAPLGGRILKLHAQAGDQVKTGDILATLSSPSFGEAQSEAARAAADFGVAQKSLDRARQLHEAGVIADKELQSSEAEFMRARAENNRTAARTRAYGGGGGTVDQQFILRAPIAGMVVERNANPGQEVRTDGESRALFVISDPSRLWVNLDLPETALGLIHSGMDVRLRLTTLGEQTRTARIEHVADFVDPDTRRTRARAVVANDDRLLKAEMFANADIILNRGEFIRVPSTAVILLGKTQYVFIEESPGRYRRQTVIAEESGFDTMRVRQGMQAGQRVVSEGALLLQQIIALSVKK